MELFWNEKCLLIFKIKKQQIQQLPIIDVTVIYMEIYIWCYG